MDYKDFEAGLSPENFWFRAKRDLIKIMISRTGAAKSSRILNIGAGTGDELRILNKYGKNYVIDVDRNALALIKNGDCFSKKVADACKLPFKDNFFDAVVSFDVFEHIGDDKRAISEAHRVLKKGGKLIFTVPAYQFLYSSHDKALDHKRRYSKRDLKKLTHKFSKVELFYWNSFMFVPIASLKIARKKKTASVENKNLPGVLNSLLYSTLRVDNVLISRGVDMPFGISIAGVCEK